MELLQTSVKFVPLHVMVLAAQERLLKVQLFNYSGLVRRVYMHQRVSMKTLLIFYLNIHSLSPDNADVK